MHKLHRLGAGHQALTIKRCTAQQMNVQPVRVSLRSAVIEIFEGKAHVTPMPLAIERRVFPSGVIVWHPVSMSSLCASNLPEIPPPPPSSGGLFWWGHWRRAGIGRTSCKGRPCRCCLLICTVIELTPALIKCTVKASSWLTHPNPQSLNCRYLRQLLGPASRRQCHHVGVPVCKDRRHPPPPLLTIAWPFCLRAAPPCRPGSTI